MLLLGYSLSPFYHRNSQKSGTLTASSPSLPSHFRNPGSLVSLSLHTAELTSPTVSSSPIQDPSSKPSASLAFLPHLPEVIPSSWNALLVFTWTLVGSSASSCLLQTLSLYHTKLKCCPGLVPSITSFSPLSAVSFSSFLNAPDIWHEPGDYRSTVWNHPRLVKLLLNLWMQHTLCCLCALLRSVHSHGVPQCRHRHLHISHSSEAHYQGASSWLVSASSSELRWGPDHLIMITSSKVLESCRYGFKAGFSTYLIVWHWANTPKCFKCQFLHF